MRVCSAMEAAATIAPTTPRPTQAREGAQKEVCTAACNSRGPAGSPPDVRTHRFLHAQPH